MVIKTQNGSVINCDNISGIVAVKPESGTKWVVKAYATGSENDCYTAGAYPTETAAKQALDRIFNAWGKDVRFTMPGAGK